MLENKKTEKFEQCIYCGEYGELTRDHIPPRSIFSKPRPNDLITVPCCLRCNREFSKDDEYFRIKITSGIDPARFPRENADSVRTINKLARPESRRFAEELLRDLVAHNLMKMDGRRVGAVLQRITRGLFFHHTGERLPPAVPIIAARIASAISVEGAPEPDWLKELPWTTIGNGTFRYALGLKPPDPFGSFWVLRFYDLRTFACKTGA